MDVREKLVEIVCDAMQADGCIGHCNYPPCFAVERVVNALIAHGVTVQDNTEITDELLKQLRNAPLTVLYEEPTVEVVQEWISVKDRLPIARKMIDGEQYYKTVAVRIAGSEVEAIAYYDQDEKRWFGTDDFPILEKVTYWYELPEWDLPQPPKGE